MKQTDEGHKEISFNVFVCACHCGHAVKVC